jgi:hypothetical protein
MEIKDRSTFIDAFKQEFDAYIGHMEEEYKEKFGEYWYNLTLKEGVVKSDFTNITIPFLNANSNSFEESFEIWVKAANEPEETAWSITINGDYGSERDELGEHHK